METGCAKGAWTLHVTLGFGVPFGAWEKRVTGTFRAPKEIWRGARRVCTTRMLLKGAMHLRFYDYTWRRYNLCCMGAGRAKGAWK
ncbi:hypothetical protein KI387_000749, partial [Taxus chinensis]